MTTGRENRLVVRFEQKHEPLLSRAAFMGRMVWHTLAAIVLIAASLGMGALGYHYFEGLPWIDAVLNASMLLGGMGPVDTMRTEGGKLFAAGYALFSGLLFVAAAGILFAPLIHRTFHRFHLEDEDGSSS